jgi:Tol biopolymer transport system component
MKTKVAILLLVAFTALAEQSLRQVFERARLLEEKNQNLNEAIQLYGQVVSQAKDQRALAARAQLQIGLLHERLGHKAEAQRAFQAVLSDFADQTDVVRQAQARLPNGKRDGAVVRRVWAGPDVDFLGAPSRDGAFLTLKDFESQDLAIRDLRTRQKRRLTKHPGTLEFARQSLPSPDGKQVAYTWYNTDSFLDLRIVGIDGSEPRVLYRNAEVSPGITDWSPDGKFLLAVLYSLKDKTYQIGLVSVRDGSVRILKTSERAVFDRPRFSPDGRYIAYGFPQRPGSGDDGIFLLALDSGREIPLLQQPVAQVADSGVDEDCPEWTPDGRGILFRSDRAGPWAAWWIQVADGKPQGTPVLVKSDLGENFMPMGFTRNGSYYYSIRTGMSDVYVAQIDLATGKVLAPPSPASQRFVGSNNQPDWSPNGRDLLFLSSRGKTAVWARRALCVRSLESGEVRELASKLKQVNWVRWSPDGRSLLAGGNVSGEVGIYRINIQTGDFAFVVHRGLGPPAAWSRDGKEIIYLKGAAERNSILARDLETGQERELHSVAKPSYYAGGAALSRDGQQLAFVVYGESRSRVLKVMPAAGGEARDLLREGQLSGQTIAWTPDGLGLLFTKRGPGDLKTELWRISVQGGEPRKLELAAEGMRELCLHPDGRHIAFTAGQDRSEVWVMENFLPVAGNREQGRKP